MVQSEKIYQTLRDEILLGILPSDTPLREIELANRFNVSRTPIRKILYRLSSEKLIRMIPNAGCFVGAFTWEEVNEVFSIRQVLEAYAAGLTAMNISPADFEKMETIYRDMELCSKNNDFERYAYLDETFHEMINSLCGNNLLIDMIHSLNDRAKLAKLHREFYAKGEIQFSLTGHRQIIDTFKDHDPSRISDLIMSHGQALFSGLTKNHTMNAFRKTEK